MLITESHVNQNKHYNCIMMTCNDTDDIIGILVLCSVTLCTAILLVSGFSTILCGGGRVLTL